MPEDAADPQSKRPTLLGMYQGWAVVLVVMVALAVASGGRFLFGVVLKPVSEEFGWGRAELAFAVTISVITLSCLQPLVGLLVDRYGSRRILIIGVVLVGLAMIPMMLVHEIWQVYLFYGFLGAFGFAATSPVNTTALVNGWFEKRRGLALSMATSGSAYGQLLVVPIVTAIMLGWGWRASYLAISATLFLLILPLVVLVVRDSPARQATLQLKRSKLLVEGPKVTLRQALRTAAYWQLSFGMFVCGFTMAFTSVHLIPYLTDMPEHSAHTMQATASLALSVVGGCSIVGSIAMGLLSDRHGHRPMLALTYALRGLAFLLLLAAGSWIPGIFAAAVVLGISWTSTTPLASALSADIYGRASIGTIFGFIFTAMNIGTGLGAWLAGFDRDVAGNYHASLLANVALGAAAAVATLAIRVRPVAALAPAAVGDEGVVPALGLAGRSAGD